MPLASSLFNATTLAFTSISSVASTSASSSLFHCLNMFPSIFSLMWAVWSLAGTGYVNRKEALSSNVADYFQTYPQVFAGATKTGAAPFLAATNPAPFGNEASFVANTPLETALPIAGNTNNTSIFGLMGHLSPYFPNPSGFGANEYPLPPGANISQVHLIHRHGSRYPTGDSSVPTFASKIQNITQNGTATFSGALSFLNTWSYGLGSEILVPKGRQELFDSGILFYYNYAQLYNTSTKIIARTTTQDRMLKSAEYFMAGFFGLEWTNNATLETIIEGQDFNNSLAGYDRCNNSNNYLSTAGTNASIIWEDKYLHAATQRFGALVTGYNWTTADTYNMQSLCPYETVAFGYSAFCSLFTFPEWQGFEYSVDLTFYGDHAFGSPTGRAVGIGYVEEVYARLENHLYDLPPGATQVNTTLDEMPLTFPLNQTLYFDFSHDANIISVITAFGLRQFNQSLPSSGPPPNQQLIISHMTPFGARFVIEIIRAPYPLKPTRPKNANASMHEFYDMSGRGVATTYAHITLSQRTVPLHESYPQCEYRDDGWCEMDAFMDVLAGLLDTARYEFSCFAHYGVENVTDGAAWRRRKRKRRDAPDAAAAAERFVLGRGMGTGLGSWGTRHRRSSDMWQE